MQIALSFIIIYWYLFEKVSARATSVHEYWTLYAFRFSTSRIGSR